MTPEELAAIKARAEAATPGRMVPYEHGFTLGWSFDTEDGTLPCGIRGMFDRGEDAVFYAQAREDVPALVAEVERLQQRALALLAALDRLVEDVQQTAREWKAQHQPTSAKTMLPSV